LNTAVRGNQQRVNRAFAKAAGVPENLLDEAAANGMTEELFLASRRTTDELYELARPTSAVDVVEFKAVIQELIDAGVPEPELNQIIKMIDAGDPTSIAPEAWQGIQRRARDVRGSIASNPVWKGWRSRMDEAVDSLDQAAIDAGGDATVMSRANTQFKIRAIGRETPAIVEAGHVPAGQVARKMGRPGFRGFGPEIMATGFPEGADPDLVNLRRALLDAAGFERNIAGGSATAGRNLALGGPVTAAAEAIADPSRAPGLAMKAGSLLGITQVAALASIGRAPQGPIAQGVRGAAAQLPSVFNQLTEEPESR
jgi:hypothetical protein